MSTGSRFAALGTISAVIGAVVDGSGSSYYDDLTACVSQSTFQYYGDAADQSTLSDCIRFRPRQSNVCQCVASGDQSCTMLHLQRNQSNCGQILDSYSSTLRASAALCIVNVLLSFSLVSAVLFLSYVKDEGDVADSQSTRVREIPMT
jgi:hypothetical protein